MKKRLQIFGWLSCLLLSSFSLVGADFTITGKVSLAQEAVPLPFYQVNIADGEGKYVATVKTTFTGKYKHTFDIPTGTTVNFEVAVVDQCTGETLIKAFESTGNKKTINFLVCDPEVLIDGISDEEEEANEEEENEGEENEGPNLPGFINCEALGLDIPVCVKNTSDELIEFPNACEALENGYKIHQLRFCNPLPIGDGVGNGFSGINCDQLGIDLPINACVKDEAGETLMLPLCTALAAGYPISQIEFCEGLGINGIGDLGNLDSIDCEALGINFPVCATDVDGNQLNYATPCAAVAAGVSLNELTICDNILGGDGLGDLLGFDCEEIAATIPFPVCITNELGETQEMALCDALSEGFSFENITLCDGSMGLLDSIDCDALGIALPVCAVDANGVELNFASPCEALDAGIALNQLTICNDFSGINTLDSLGILDGLTCENLGLNLDIPVCTVNELGETMELMLCDALSQGISLQNIELCEGALDAIDCEGLGINVPVCSVDSDGNTLTFNNPCEALSAGVALNELTICEGTLDEILDNIDCENIELDLPFEICVTNATGEQEKLNLCEAISQGFTPEDIVICGNSLDNIGTDDCEGLGLNFPVCAKNAAGDFVEYANPCAAFAAGIAIEDFTICNDLLEDAMASLFNTTSTEEESIVIEKAELYPNPTSSQLTLALNFAENAAYEIHIHSMNGNAIYRQKYHALNGENVTRLDVSSLTNGIYIVKVITTQNIKAMKFIKQ